MTVTNPEPQRCSLCPRSCGARRAEGQLGYCRSGTGFAVGAICVHRGEEPPISGPHGIANVFFTHCNLQCVYCQNYQISRNRGPIVEHALSLEQVVRCIEAALGRGVGAVGFVSPSHCIPQMTAIIHALRDRRPAAPPPVIPSLSRNLSGACRTIPEDSLVTPQPRPRPAFVMNTNAYDRAETLASLEGLIDAYLPDLKYMDSDLAARYSDAADYPDVAAKALREMYRQKGSRLALAASGYVESGLIIRHLVLPGQVGNSKRCLRFIADCLSTDVHVSLMAQYRPTPAVAGHPELGRCLGADEYQEVVAELERLGFYRGWTQDLASPGTYHPDFSQSHPFQ